MVFSSCRPRPGALGGCGACDITAASRSLEIEREDLGSGLPTFSWRSRF